ncbi:MAG: small multi-drug export protein [Chloroflexota bacterium]|nr:small multi-drug export protein [Chloroflexota bacterium]MDE2883738.1 small multi-drug export protein [Chloroflexota bacterium]
MPDELLVLLTAMTPIGELRASIPLAITSMEMPWPRAFGLSVVGNVIPVPFILYALRMVGARIEAQQNVAGRLLRWRTARIQQSWGPLVRRYGFFGIVLAVAIPLPLTGAWTGALIVWTLHVPARRGLPAIAMGVVIAGIVVTALTLAGIELIRLT